MANETDVTDSMVVSDSTEKTSTASTGQTEVEGQASQGEKDIAGDEQSSSEDGKEQGTERNRAPFRSKNRTIYELKQAIRERDAKLMTFEEKLSRFEQQIQQRPQNQKPSRTFFDAPEDTVRDILAENLKNFKAELLNDFNNTRQQDQQSVQWKQETSEAAKFITTQKGMTEDDISDIEELVRSTPEMNAMSPMQRAKYAMFLWREERGIGDRSAAKARASTVTGAPPAGSATAMSDEELNREIDKLPRDVSKWTPEDHKKFDSLDREIRKTKMGQS